MKRIFNTSNLLLLGIAVAAAALLYLGLLWNCSAQHAHVVFNNDFSNQTVIPA